MEAVLFKNLTLQTAYATWVENKFGNCWVIYDKDHNELAVMPKGAEEYISMAAIKLGREFEKKAYQEGYELAQGATKAVYVHKIIDLRNEIEMLKQMNISVSTELQRMMIMDDEKEELGL